MEAISCDRKAREFDEEIAEAQADKAAEERKFEAELEEARQATKRVEAQAKQKAKALHEAKDRAEKGIAMARGELKEWSQAKAEAAQAQKTSSLKFRRQSQELKQQRMLELSELSALESWCNEHEEEILCADTQLAEAAEEVFAFSGTSRALEGEIHDVHAEEAEIMAERWAEESTLAYRARQEAEARQVAEAVVWRTAEAEEAVLREELWAAEESCRALRGEEVRVSEHLSEVRSETSALRAALRDAGGEPSSIFFDDEALRLAAAERDELRAEVACLRDDLEEALTSSAVRVAAGEARAEAVTAAARGAELRDSEAAAELMVVYEQLRVACDRDRHELAMLMASMEESRVAAFFGADVAAPTPALSASAPAPWLPEVDEAEPDLSAAVKAMAEVHQEAMDDLKAQGLRLVCEVELGLFDLEIMQAELSEARRREDLKCEELEVELRRLRASPDVIARELGVGCGDAAGRGGAARGAWWRLNDAIAIASEAAAAAARPLSFGLAEMRPLRHARDALAARLRRPEGLGAPRVLDAEASELREQVRQARAERDQLEALLRDDQAAAAAATAAVTAAAARAAAVVASGVAVAESGEGRRALESLQEEYSALEAQVEEVSSRVQALHREEGLAREALARREADTEEEAVSMLKRAEHVQDEVDRVTTVVESICARTRELMFQEEASKATADFEAEATSRIEERLAALAEADEDLEERYRALGVRADAAARACELEEEALRRAGAELRIISAEAKAEELTVEAEEAVLEAASANRDAEGASELREAGCLVRAEHLSLTSEVGAERLLRALADEEMTAHALDAEAVLEAQASRRARETMDELRSEEASVAQAARREAAEASRLQAEYETVCPSPLSSWRGLAGEDAAKALKAGGPLAEKLWAIRAQEEALAAEEAELEELASRCPAGAGGCRGGELIEELRRDLRAEEADEAAEEEALAVVRERAATEAAACAAAQRRVLVARAELAAGHATRSLDTSVPRLLGRRGALELEIAEAHRGLEAAKAALAAERRTRPHVGEEPNFSSGGSSPSGRSYRSQAERDVAEAVARVGMAAAAAAAAAAPAPPARAAMSGVDNGSGSPWCMTFREEAEDRSPGLADRLRGRFPWQPGRGGSPAAAQQAAAVRQLLEERHSQETAAVRDSGRALCAESRRLCEARRAHTRSLELELAEARRLMARASGFASEADHVRLERRLAAEVTNLDRIECALRAAAEAAVVTRQAAGDGDGGGGVPEAPSVVPPAADGAAGGGAGADPKLLGEMRASLQETCGFLQVQRRQLQAAIIERDRLQVRLQTALERYSRQMAGLTPEPPPSAFAGEWAIGS